MDLATIIGLLLGFGAIFGGTMIEGGSPMALVSIPAFVIVIVGAIMEIEIAAREERHEQGIAVMEALGGFAPTLGIMGTVLGLINVLSNLSDTSALGGHIAGAFIATFYGVFTANVLYLPLGAK